MSEAIVVNLFFTARVVFLGAIFIAFPRISRKGLMFGVYIGESTADREATRRLLSSWTRSVIGAMGLTLALGYGISLAGQPVAGNLTGTAFILLLALGLYIRFHFKARELAPAAAARQGEKAVAVLDAGEPKGKTLAKVALAICAVASLGAFAYANIAWDPSAELSYLVVMSVPAFNLVVTPILALSAVLTASAKLSVREGGGGRSAEAQAAFRDINTSVFSWMALLTCAFLTVLSVQVAHFEESNKGALVITLLVGAVIVVGFGFGSLVRIMRSYGQGGALRERGGVDAPLTDGLADDARWVMGMFYVNRNDPSILVEKRFGIGYAFNWGNRTAVLIMASYLVLVLGVSAIVLMGALTRG